MEDRYLFKAKRLDNGEWVQGYLYGIWEKKYILWGMTNDIPNMIEVNPSTICQCTGLKDKNGKLIWENDILVGHLDDNYPQNATYEMVLWNKSGFCTKEQGSNDILKFCEFDQKNFEVCGNIFDNPELFESEDNMTESEAKAILERDLNCMKQNKALPDSIEATEMAIQTLGKQIRKTSVRTKEIVYRFSVLSDRDKDRIISKFQSIKYSKEQNIEILLNQLAQNRLEEEFLNTIKSYGEDIMAMALEKQIPYKPREYEDKYYSCKCGNVLLYKWKKYSRELTDKKMGLPYCLNCGQRLDWSDEE